MTCGPDTEQDSHKSDQSRSSTHTIYHHQGSRALQGAHRGGGWTHEHFPTKGFHSSLKFSKLPKDAIQIAINQSATVKIRTLKYYFQNLPTKENLRGLETNWICEWSLVFTTHTHTDTQTHTHTHFRIYISRDSDGISKLWLEEHGVNSFSMLNILQ